MTEQTLSGMESLKSDLLYSLNSAMNNRIIKLKLYELQQRNSA